MSKTTLTIEDFIKAMKMMTNDNTMFICLKAIDPDLTDEELYGAHERLKFFKKAYDLTEGEAAAKVLEDDQITDVIIALAFWGYCNFSVGHSRGRGFKEDAISKVLDKLADQMEQRKDVIKGSFNIKDDNENRPN